MNCKPGDLANIVGPTNDYLGALVEVLHAAPVGEFKLPDGFRAYGRSTDAWVIRFLSEPQKVGTVLGTRLAQFASVRDSYLRPIRPSEAPDETLAWKDIPSLNEVTA
jgi:hypothetical protein